MQTQSLIKDLGLLEVVASDVVTFAQGESVSQQVDGYTVSIKKLDVAAPVAPYQEFSGSFISIFELVLADAAAFASGVPIQVAEKVGNTWYGVSISKNT